MADRRSSSIWGLTATPRVLQSVLIDLRVCATTTEGSSMRRAVGLPALLAITPFFFSRGQREGRGETRRTAIDNWHRKAFAILQRFGC